MIKNITFGDFFESKGKIYRIFTNYHPKGNLLGQYQYKIKKNKILKKQDYFVDSVKSIPLNKVDRYYESTRCEGKNEPYDYICKKFRSIGIKSYGITGSYLLRCYGFKIGHEKSDLDIVIKGKKESKLLMRKINSLYDKRFENYSDNGRLLFKRRTKISKIKTDLRTMKFFESKKSLGLIDGRHVNITPSYKMNNKVMSCIYDKNYLNKGYVKLKVRIKGIDHSDSVPGYYEVETNSKDYDIRFLRTNIYYFSIGNRNLLGKQFNIRALLFHNPFVKNKKYQSILEMDSRCNIFKFRMILL